MQDTGFFQPQEIHQHLQIHEGMQIADFGSGSGEIAVRIGALIGESGRVTALDVLSTAIESVQAKAKASGLDNIVPVRANLEIPGSSGLADGSQDAVFLASILWQSPKPEAILHEATRVLKPDGTIMVIEWKTKLPAEKLNSLLVKISLRVTKEFPAGAYHYGILAKK